MDAIQSAGIVVIGSVGNAQLDHIASDLNNGKSIMVGSHNRANCISKFSNGLCKSDICSVGEDVLLESVLSKLRSGTSYAVPQVTILVANYIPFAKSHECEASFIKSKLMETAKNVTCWCSAHEGKMAKRKMNPSEFMSKLHFDDDEPTAAKRFQMEGSGLSVSTNS